MGCASSKKSTRCRHCQSPYSPLSRSYSVPIHHPAERKGDSYHLVALTSTTLGSLKLDSIDHMHLNGISNDGRHHHDHDNHNDDCSSFTNNDNNESRINEFSNEVVQAKTWSSMINEKIPKAIPRTPIRTPPGEPETINSWELMAGLEDDSPLRVPPNVLNRCFSYHGVTNTTSPDQQLTPKFPENDQAIPKLQENGSASPKPMWVKVMDDDTNSNSNPVIKDFDPEIISTFRKALEDLSPRGTVNVKSPENEKSGKGFFSKKVSNAVAPAKCPPNGENKVVIYFTSLRGVRKTYEDCCHVRIILKGFGFRIDERDVSMHSGFREELKELLGDEYRGGLPKVFVRGDYIGGVEEVKQLHEDGELEKLLQGCDLDDGVCEACGDVRFVPCERCSGSCKIYYEDEDYDCDEDEREGEEDGGGFYRCPDCNENGIVRCPVCCD